MVSRRPLFPGPALGALLLLPLLAQEVAAELIFDAPWVRAMPPGQAVTAAYGGILNAGSETITITGVTTDFSGKGEIHTSEQEGGSVRMRRIDPVNLTPGSRLLLEPGGPHLMLMDISTMPAADSTVKVCLQSSAGEYCADAPVLRKGPETPHDASHAHH